jgi:hypothetical protein
MGCPEDIKIFPESPLSPGLGEQYASAAEIFQENQMCHKQKPESLAHQYRMELGWGRPRANQLSQVPWSKTHQELGLLKKFMVACCHTEGCSASRKVAGRSTSENGYPSTAIEQTQLTLRPWLGWQEFTSTPA